MDSFKFNRDLQLDSSDDGSVYWEAEAEWDSCCSNGYASSDGYLTRDQLLELRDWITEHLDRTADA
jgi:hypothetical protein